MPVRLLDTPATKDAPSKKGLFSVLGGILTKTAVGLESPQALAQLQQRELEAETEFARYRQQRLDYEQERKDRQAQAELDNYLKMKDAGLSVPSSGAGLTGRPDMVQLGGKFYQQDPESLLKAQLNNKKTMSDIRESELKAQLLNKFTSGDMGGNVPVGTTFNAGGLNIPLNPALNESEQASVKASEMIPSYISGIRSLISDPELKGNLSKFSVDNLPYFMVGNPKAQELKRYIDSLKSTIPFARGGKALTKTESDRIDRLLNVFGRTDSVIEKNLSDFEKEFVLGGKLTGMGSADVEKMKSGGNKLKTSSGVEFTYEEVK